jgi:L-iditol 2-dehydrogenase
MMQPMGETMRAAVLAAPGRIEVAQIPVPEPGPGEVLVRVRACGICGSDLHFYRGELPARPGNPIGHEFAGEIERLGPAVEGWSAGQRVAVEPVWVCRDCEYCRRGEPQLCQQRRLMGASVPGGMAELVLVPDYALRPLPGELDYGLGALVEPAAVAVHALHLAKLSAGERVLVLGGGSIGLLAALAARSAAAASVAITCRYQQQLRAAQALGADEAITADESAGRRLASMAQSAPFDLVVDSVGTPETLQQALALARPGGRVMLLGVPTRPLTLSGMSLMLREVRLLASSSYCRAGDATDFARTTDLVLANRNALQSLLTHSLPLGKAPDAFRTAADKRSGSIKVQLLSQE